MSTLTKDQRIQVQRLGRERLLAEDERVRYQDLALSSKAHKRVYDFYTSQAVAEIARIDKALGLINEEASKT